MILDMRGVSTGRTCPKKYEPWSINLGGDCDANQTLHLDPALVSVGWHHENCIESRFREGEQSEGRSSWPCRVPEVLVDTHDT